MVWQKIDDQFGVSKKVLRIPRARRFQCIGLWTLAGNYSARVLSDGVLEAHELDEMGAKPADVAELIRVDLWHGHGHECPKCKAVADGDVIIHDFLDWNPSRADVEATREAERVRKAKQRADKKNARPIGSPTNGPAGTPTGSDAVSGHPVPDPIDVTYDTESSHQSDAREIDSDSNELDRQRAQKAGITDLTGVRAQLATATGQQMTPRGAITLAEAILLKSAKGVRDVDAYIATVCRNSPHEVQKAYFDLDIEGVA
jgi:hypothetical protein